MVTRFSSIATTQAATSRCSSAVAWSATTASGWSPAVGLA